MHKKLRDATITATVCCVTVLSVSAPDTIAAASLTCIQGFPHRCDSCRYYQHRQRLEIQAIAAAVAAERILVRR